MTSIDNFKLFVRKNPKLIDYVKEGNMSWQKFYELYDLYGEDNSIWNEYLEKKEEKKESNILDIVKNIDTDKLQDGISSVQKVISLVGDMLIKDNKVSEYKPRPIYRRFDD